MQTLLLLFALVAAVRDPLPDSQQLAGQAAGIARAAGLSDIIIVVTVPPRWYKRGIVDAQTNVRGQVVDITVSPILLEDMDADGIRGMLAHELAHTRLSCGPHYRSEREHLACEIEADALAARWVGKRTVLRSLCQLIASGWAWRYNTNAMPMYERIRRLHDRDIP